MLEGYRNIIEETIFKQEEKVEDPEFICDETSLISHSSSKKIDPDDIEWRTIHEYLGDYDYTLFSSDVKKLISFFFKLRGEKRISPPYSPFYQ